MFTTREKQLLAHATRRVKALFKERPYPAHNFDHADRVRKWAMQIAKAEKANVFLSAFIALIHDIGRAFETDHPGVRHHELSYRVFRIWLADDAGFADLMPEERRIILYSIRYHWNNAADKYFEAIILRDADKLDLFGAVGLKRHLESAPHDEERLMHLIRLVYDSHYWIMTKTAKKILKKNTAMMGVINRFYLKKLQSKILPIEL
jgi:HD superfamily phosphodiesterase